MGSGREEDIPMTDARVGWVSVIVIGDDYDAFLLSCDLYNLFLIGSQLSDIASSIFVEILLCTLLS